MIASLNRTLFTGHSSDAVDRLWKECVESALPMTERLRASEWCERFRVIPEGKSHTPGPISLAKTPHVIMPLDLACSGQVREAIVAWAVQTSKTEGFLLSKLLYTLLHRRVNAGYVMPTRDRMEEEADQKIIPALLAAVGGEEAIASSKLSRVSFRAGNTLYMYGGNSPTAIKGPAIPEGIGDEVDDDALRADSFSRLSSFIASSSTSSPMPSGI
ncbi:MAG: phage terminase large subunit family protein, partial [Planctomycetota bacterium]